MTKRKISWEIVVAGLAFVGIAIYVLGRSDSATQKQTRSEATAKVAPTPSKPVLPQTFVIDLQNLENLRNLENLKNLKNLENLEQLKAKLKELEQLKEIKVIQETTKTSIDQSLKQLEEQFKELEEADYKFKLQDSKIYINKDYNVKEASWAEVSPGVYIYRKSFNASGMRKLNLTLSQGNISLVGTDNGEAEFTLQATGDVQSDETLAEKLSTGVDISPETAVFDISSREDFMNRLNLEATLSVPSNIPVEAVTKGGHIKITNLNESKVLKTNGGHITLENVGGRTEAKTLGGHIIVNDSEGKTILFTKGGHIQVKHYSGELEAQTSGGNIEINRLSGSARAKTSGGNINVEILSASGPLAFATSAGNISLRLPVDIQADLKASGTRVILSDIFDFTGQQSSGLISGSLNSGGIPVSAKCDFGNVYIKQND